MPPYPLISTIISYKLSKCGPLYKTLVGLKGDHNAKFSPSFKTFDFHLFQNNLVKTDVINFMLLTNTFISPIDKEADSQNYSKPQTK